MNVPRVSLLQVATKAPSASFGKSLARMGSAGGQACKRLTLRAAPGKPYRVVAALAKVLTLAAHCASRCGLRGTARGTLMGWQALRPETYLA